MRALVCALILALICCSPNKPLPTRAQFDRWLAAEAGRAESFAAFEAMLREAGVADVAPAYTLWRVDQLRTTCVAADFQAPPRAAWRNIVPALVYVRDHVKPAIGAVEVVSAYRDEGFNACVGGARASAYRDFYAVDLVPLDKSVDRAALIAALCPVHARRGPRERIGLGIYAGVRFHIDARSYRGWGEDFRGASFPCRA